MAEMRNCASCGQVMLVAEGEHPLKAWTCEECKPKPITGTAERLFNAPQTMPGQMTF